MDLNAFLNESVLSGTENQRVSLEGLVETMFPYNQETVSNEGLTELFDNVKNYFFSGKPSVSNLSGGWFDRMSVVRKTLGKTYMDPNWLNRRQFNLGDVKAIKFVEFLSNNGTWTPDLSARIGEMLKALAEIRQYYYDTTIAWYDTILPQIKNYSVETVTYSDAFRLERFLARLDYPEFKFLKTIALGGARITQLDTVLVTPRTVVVPSLDKNGVVDLCQEILSIAEEFDEYNNMVQRIWNHPCYRKLTYLIEATDDQPGVDDPSGVHAELHRMFNTMQIFDASDVYDQFRYLANVIRACARYIDASVR